MTPMTDFEMMMIHLRTAFDVFSQGSGWKARLYVKLKEADRDR